MQLSSSSYSVTGIPWAQGVGGSNPLAPTKSLLILKGLIVPLPSSSLVSSINCVKTVSKPF